MLMKRKTERMAQEQAVQNALTDDARQARRLDQVGDTPWRSWSDQTLIYQLKKFDTSLGRADGALFHQLQKLQPNMDLTLRRGSDFVQEVNKLLVDQGEVLSGERCDKCLDERKGS